MKTAFFLVALWNERHETPAPIQLGFFIVWGFLFFKLQIPNGNVLFTDWVDSSVIPQMAN